MSTDRPGFRRAGDLTRASSTIDDREVGRGPFTQAQITHLMKTEFSRARRYEYPLACVLIQVDRLQSLTEVHGAEFRVEIRRQLAAIVEEKTRGHDHLGTISDGAYLLVMPHTGAESGQLVAERIRSAFSDVQMVADGKSLVLSLSLGVAACEDRDTMFFDTLVSQAEVALDWAVREGGDRTVLFRRDKFIEPL
ncbi:MAG: GGDEF domain-containing protein [Planctomycetes bacterium]|nr:GGDEF domain-containing protein [Planctomycetota bacterium]